MISSEGASSLGLGLALSAKGRRTGDQPISYLMAAVLKNPGLINLAAGFVDEPSLPGEACADLARRVFGDPARARAALQYDTTLGLAALRKAMLAHLESLDGKPAAALGLTPEDIVITNGSQQALYLIGDCLLDPGDIVIAANPCYFVYSSCLTSFGAEVLTAPMDDDGIDIDAVERILIRLETEGRLDRVKLVYVTSYFQNPTGLTLSAERRPRLLEIVKRFSRRNRILILEDAAYRELCYEGVGLPSIKSYDADNLHTILACTFSKPFAPGLRTGYTAMPGDLMEAVLRQKGNHDFGSASLNQHLLLEAMNSGVYQAQVKRLCDTYRLKRDEMLLALDRHMPRVAGLRWTRPAGGLYVWLTLPDGMDTSRHAKLFESALNHGVLYVPGDYCYQPDEAGSTPKNHIRLSYGNVAIGDIAPGVERLAAVIKGQIAADPFHVGHEHGSVHSGATGRGASRDAVASIGAVAAIGASGAATSAGVVATRESVASIDAVAAGGGSAR